MIIFKKTLFTILMVAIFAIPANAARYLKQSTASQMVLVGAFVDYADGITMETGITLGAADYAYLMKSDGTEVDISSNTWAASTNMDGFYKLTLTDTDTSSLGKLTVAIADVSVCAPVWETFEVVTANVYDSLFSTDKLQVHVDEMTAGIITATVMATDSIGSDELATLATTEIWTASTRTLSGTVNDFDELITSLDDTATVATAVVDEFETQSQADPTGFHVNLLEVEGTDATTYVETRTLAAASYFDPAADTVADVTTVGSVSGAVGSVTGAVGSISGITFPTNFADLAIAVTTGRVDVSLIEGGDATDALATGAGAALTSYDPPTATEMTSAFTEIKGATWASGTDTLEALRDRGDAAWITATGFSTHAAADIWSVATRELSGTVGDFDALILELDDTATVVDAVWDEASTGHLDAGKAGAQLWTDVDAILVDTAVIGAAGAGLTAVPWNAAWDTEVQSEANDALVALDLDHLLNVALPTPAASDITLNSAFGYLLDDGTAWTYDRTTDSLEAIVASAASASDVADAVWDELKGGHTTTDSYGLMLKWVFDATFGRMKIDTTANTMTFYDYDAPTTPIDTFYLYDDTPSLSHTNVYERTLTPY